MSPHPAVVLVDDLPTGADAPYLPPAGKAAYLPFYDLLSRVTGVRRRHARLVALAEVRPGDRVLDLGCGTGAVAVRVARTVPGAHVTGLDPDLPALRRAARAARRARVPLTLVRGYGQSLPLPDASVDRVVSSLALHHVPADARAATAAEIARVLRPGGTVTVLDFGAHDHGGPARRGHLHRRGDVADRLRDNLDDGIARLLAGAGLVDAREVASDRIAGLPLTFVQAARSSSGPR
ncbi:class I SAM-dependent methyltransferase [Cellulomonas fimi]|uniref:Methyltransferase type 11 n=1 Tax=Cellulomonas fimi (strain ATCC 484 / DSM 20113 / JCM 1341 / CCUG 24087 / LMG 16345 / NBRC 15513 / NCIMB 8980 / NCTC 7547 / NRS-133) TaxID=590998 RepID=F4GZA9_CELFA|nr:methyltransferase domain-containing protein [Cellulomonas fimi]AEE47225.1 Methyltransferase type 11 [Cellulomonas fimi ATCC 484]NNH08454.1 methyltransferase domain-containing protein [Cellulomonas fimi]VEH35644.1 Rebeccamycin O-methyltransferase [Cellulomonas fimi]